MNEISRIKKEQRSQDWLKSAKKIANDSNYCYSFDDVLVSGNPRQGKTIHQRVLNCRDEICPGSHERTSKIRQLMHKKIEIKPNAFQEVSKMVSEMHKLMKEEHMALTDCNEYQADHFLDRFVDFNHFKYHESTDGKKFISIDPKIGPKYEE